MVFYEDGVLWGWCFMRMVCYEDGVLWGWCVTRMVCYEDGVLWGWCVMRMVCYEDGVLRGWCVMRPYVQHINTSSVLNFKTNTRVSSYSSFDFLYTYIYKFFFDINYQPDATIFQFIFWRLFTWVYADYMGRPSHCLPLVPYTIIKLCLHFWTACREDVHKSWTTGCRAGVAYLAFWGRS